MSIYDELIEILDNIELPEGFSLKLGTDLTEEGKFHRFYLQIKAYRRDTVTGEMGWGYGGKAYLSPHMVRSEVVQTAFGLFKGYLEHEAREGFKYLGRRIYGPHINVDALHEAAKHIDVRKKADA